MLRVTLIQTSLYWHDPVANRAALEETIFALPEPTDLIVLPEMFTTGFTMEAPAVAEPPRLTTHRWMQQMAAQTNAVVTGSYVVREGEQYYNRLLWMQPDGQFMTYDKRHLFRMAGEHNTYSSGNKRLIQEWRRWRICPLICYDLRFPVWSRNTPQDYDLLLYVANWPAVRQQPWDTLLQARAIENLSYVLGVNRVGDDEKGNHYAGGSALIDYKGEVLFRHYETPVIHQQTISLDDLRAFREKFPAHLDADEFTYSITFGT
ncbi:MAG: amidohydrolase [Cytophagales bacterium]|nr:MAG: amidohydrolase [Cytophagales bacterium]